MFLSFLIFELKFCKLNCVLSIHVVKVIGVYIPRKILFIVCCGSVIDMYYSGFLF